MRAALVLLAFASVAPAWVDSVEFPWNAFPRPLWERELVWLKNIGVTHVSLPPEQDPARLADLVRILRRLRLEGDLEGPVPDALQTQTRQHGGPLTGPLVGAVRISATSPDALLRSRRLLESGSPALIWTDVEDTLGPSGYRPGAVNFAGAESAGTVALRRDIQLARYWGDTFASLHPVPGAKTALPGPGIAVRQLAAENGVSFVAVANASAKPWTGEIRAHDAQKRIVSIPGVTVPPHGSMWLPVNVPLAAGPLCKDCTAFGAAERLLHATAELTAMEYENGILAMEFAAPSAGEVVLQLSREPSGPLVAGGKPTEFDWDDTAKTVRLPVPAGKGAGDHVRIGLAIDAPDATAFFDSARVLMIGETNHLTAQFSSDAIAQRSRLRIAPEMPVTQDPAKEPLKIVYHIGVPETAVHGDHADLSIETDGAQMSHARPQLLRPVTLRFMDAIGVRMGPNSTLNLAPAVVPVNRRAGRDVTVAIRNNAPEIRNFKLELRADGLEFSPATMDVSVGASATREVSFRVFATGAAPGLHVGEAKISGAASAQEAVRFVVIPPNGAAAFTADGFDFLESAKIRASFFAGRWLEWLNKDNGQDAIPAGGVPFGSGPVEARGDKLKFGEKSYRLQDLEPLLPKPKR